MSSPAVTTTVATPAADVIAPSRLETAKRTGGRFENLDVVRGVAATAVVLQHGAERAWPDGFGTFSCDWFSPGMFGVTTFLLVSGFVIPLSLEKCGNLKEFWIARFFRLFPLYWLSIALTLATVAVGYSIGPEARDAGWSVWLMNLTMLQQFLGHPHVLALYWTLSLEMMLYLSCTALFAIGLLNRTRLWLALGMVVLVVGFIGGPLVLHRRLPGAWAFLFLTTFVGTLIYRYQARAVTGRSLAGFVAALFPLAVGIAIVDLELYPAGKFPFRAVAAVTSWVAAYAFVLAMVACRRASWPKSWVWLGVISYSMYLMHPFVMLTLRQFCTGWTYVLGSLAGSIAISSVTYLALEKPAIRFGKSLLHRERTSSS